MTDIRGYGPPSRRADLTVAEQELDDDLQRTVRHTSMMRQGFYIVVLLVALAGQVSGAVQALGIPLAAAIPAVGALELGGIVVLANADVRRRLGEKATASRLLSVAIAAGAVAFNWLAHDDHLLGGFFSGMSALGYLVWLMHTENQRRDRLRAKGNLPPTTPAYEVFDHWLRHPWLTRRAKSLAKANPELGLYDSLAAARAEVGRERRQSAISKVLHRKIRAAVDPNTADIAVAVYDLNEIATRLASHADYDGLTALIAADLSPERLAASSATTPPAKSKKSPTGSEPTQSTTTQSTTTQSTAAQPATLHSAMSHATMHQATMSQATMSQATMHEAAMHQATMYQAAKGQPPAMMPADAAPGAGYPIMAGQTQQAVPGAYATPAGHPARFPTQASRVSAAPNNGQGRPSAVDPPLIPSWFTASTSAREQIQAQQVAGDLSAAQILAAQLAAGHPVAVPQTSDRTQPNGVSPARTAPNGASQDTTAPNGASPARTAPNGASQDSTAPNGQDRTAKDGPAPQTDQATAAEPATPRKDPTPTPVLPAALRRDLENQLPRVRRAPSPSRTNNSPAAPTQPTPTDESRTPDRRPQSSTRPATPPAPNDAPPPTNGAAPTAPPASGRPNRATSSATESAPTQQPAPRPAQPPVPAQARTARSASLRSRVHATLDAQVPIGDDRDSTALVALVAEQLELDEGERLTIGTYVQGWQQDAESTRPAQAFLPQPATESA